ncbi:MAG: hypothetical protein AB7E55_18230 [Pigmentiphaga sp.]
MTGDTLSNRHSTDKYALSLVRDPLHNPAELIAPGNEMQRKAAFTVNLPVLQSSVVRKPG